MKEEKDIEAVYSAVQGFSTALVEKMDADPLVVAAVLASTALSIYKTTLSPEDFDAIVAVSYTHLTLPTTCSV